MHLPDALFLNLTISSFALIIVIHLALPLTWSYPYAFFSVNDPDSDERDNCNGAMNKTEISSSGSDESENEIGEEEKNYRSEKEPSVLDYVKSLLTPWKGDRIRISLSEITQEDVEQEKISEEISPPDSTDASLDLKDWTQRKETGEPLLELEAERATSGDEKNGAFVEVSKEGKSDCREEIEIDDKVSKGWHWRTIVALLFAFAGQIAFEPPERSLNLGLLFYAFATILLFWGYFQGEWKLPNSIKVDEAVKNGALESVNTTALWIGIPLILFAFIILGGNRFTLFKIFIWFLSIFFLMRAFWVPDRQSSPWYIRLRSFFRTHRWRITLSAWLLLVIGGFLLAIFFRLHMLERVPAEMFSDHAEKLYDVMDVLDGQTRIFFPRNTGREAIQMYVTAAVVSIFGTGISFLSLKIGTAMAGLLTLPFIYLLGKEVGGRRVGLFAMVFAGISYWPNVITRVGLRFAFYPLFVSLTLVFLVRGLRRGRRNDLLLSGLFLGLGLHGYSPFRIVPLVVVAAFALYLLHNRFNMAARKALRSLGALIGVSFVVFLPLLRYMLESSENWQRFWFRSLTRLGEVERGYPESPLRIFFGNTWNALTMYWWDNGEIWVHSIPGRPALDVVSAVLLLFGIVMVLLRYAKFRKWEDSFLLLSIPLLMLPSILSIAFPSENPSLNRSAGTIVPVFILAGFGLEGLFRGFKHRILLGWGVVALLLLWSSIANYELVFNQYARLFRLSSWNTSEMGKVIEGYTESIGDRDSAWVIPHPHWVDTRLVGISAGFPRKDYAIWQDQLRETLVVPSPKLFILHPDDGDGLNRLRELYPQGSLQEYHSEIPFKGFRVYFVPPN